MLITVKTASGASVDIHTTRETLTAEDCDIAVQVAQGKAKLPFEELEQANIDAWNQHALAEGLKPFDYEPTLEVAGTVFEVVR